MKKPTKLKEPIEILRDLNDRVQNLARGIQDFLDRYDEPTLISRIMETVEKTKSKKITVSFIERFGKVSPSKAIKLINEMKEMGLIKLDTKHNGFAYHIKK